MTIEEGLTDVRITPLARRVAAERGINLSEASGSGYSGRIFVRDLDNVEEESFTKTEGTVAFVPVSDEGDALQAVVAPEPVAPAPVAISPEPLPEIPIIVPEPVAMPSLEIAPAPVMETVQAADEQPVEATPGAAEENDAIIEAAISADEDVAGVMRMNDLRRSVALMTAESAAQTAAVTQLVEMDITELLEFLERFNGTREKQDQISLTALYIKAIALCIREKDRFRMRLSKARNAYLLMDGAHVAIHIGVGDGFVTPVIRDGDVKQLAEISAEAAYFCEKAKHGDISEKDCKGAAITLFDKGESGIYAFTPIIKQPEPSILGMGAPYRRLIMTEKGIENRHFVMQSLTFDHRVINGSEADDFQSRLKEMLEEPGSVFG